MINTTPNYGYGYPNNFAAAAQGMVPNQQQMPKTGNWLSADRIAMLQKEAAQFNLSVTDEDIARGQCNHYHLNGVSALIPDGDGSGGCRCAICGTHFTSREFSQEDVQNATQNILDILNTIKIMYLSLDPSAACDYFQIIPFIEKIPELYEVASNDFKKYEGIDNFIPTNQQNPFNVFNMMTNPAMGMYQQAQMNQQPMGYGAPMGYGPAPQQQMGMGYGPAPQQPGFNPLYGQPMAAPGYQPQMNGYAMNPMGAAAPQGYVNSNMPQGNMPQGQPAQQQTATADAAGKDVAVNTKFEK